VLKALPLVKTILHANNTVWFIVFITTLKGLYLNVDVLRVFVQLT